MQHVQRMRRISTPRTRAESDFAECSDASLPPLPPPLFFIPLPPSPIQPEFSFRSETSFGNCNCTPTINSLRCCFLLCFHILLCKFYQWKKSMFCRSRRVYGVYSQYGAGGQQQKPAQIQKRKQIWCWWAFERRLRTIKLGKHRPAPLPPRTMWDVSCAHAWARCRCSDDISITSVDRHGSMEH